jgi:hypothetical protein
LKKVVAHVLDWHEVYHFESSKEARPQYERIKNKIVAGEKTLEISDKDRCDVFLLEYVVSIGLKQ